jgi:hypothetical protein
MKLLKYMNKQMGNKQSEQPSGCPRSGEPGLSVAAPGAGGFDKQLGGDGINLAVRITHPR